VPNFTESIVEEAAIATLCGVIFLKVIPGKFQVTDSD
jgi:hypothetical protein